MVYNTAAVPHKPLFAQVSMPLLKNQPDVSLTKNDNCRVDLSLRCEDSAEHSTVIKEPVPMPEEWDAKNHSRDETCTSTLKASNLFGNKRRLFN